LDSGATLLIERRIAALLQLLLWIQSAQGTILNTPAKASAFFNALTGEWHEWLYRQYQRLANRLPSGCRSDYIPDVLQNNTFYKK
jgi:hypothetical protein